MNPGQNVLIVAISPIAKLDHYFNWKRNWGPLEKLLNITIEKNCFPDVIVLPEDFLGWDDGFNSEKLDELKKYAKTIECYIVCGGTTSNHNSHKTAWVFGPNGEVFQHHKTFLTGDETRRLVPGDTFETINIDKAKLGIAICSEFVFAEVGRILSWKGADILLWPSTVRLQRSSWIQDEVVRNWLRQYVSINMQARAIEGGIFTLFVNINQNDSTTKSIEPLHLACDPAGEFLDPVLHHQDTSGLLTTFEINIQRVKRYQDYVRNLGLHLPGPTMVKELLELALKDSSQKGLESRTLNWDE